MNKAVKSFLDLIRAKGERDFVKLHQKSDPKLAKDQNGNGPETFSGLSVKTFDRSEHHQGYNAGEDEAHYEETDYLDGEQELITEEGSGCGNPKHSVFDHEDCWKCGGTGYIHPFSHVANGTCFRCGGSGAKLTKHGKADHARWQKARDKYTLRPAHEVKVGDAMKPDSNKKWHTVASVENSRMQGASLMPLKDGETPHPYDAEFNKTHGREPTKGYHMVPYDHESRVIKVAGTHHHIKADSLVRSVPMDKHAGIPKAKDFVTPKKEKKNMSEQTETIAEELLEQLLEILEDNNLFEAVDAKESLHGWRKMALQRAREGKLHNPAFLARLVKTHSDPETSHKPDQYLDIHAKAKQLYDTKYKDRDLEQKPVFESNEPSDPAKDKGKEKNKRWQRILAKRAHKDKNMKEEVESTETDLTSDDLIDTLRLGVIKEQAIELEFEDGKVTIPFEAAADILGVYDKLSEEDQKEFVEMLSESTESFQEGTSFLNEDKE